MSECYIKPIVKILMLKGKDGDGKGISSISKTGTSGLIDTYEISLTDGTKKSFTVTNGKGIKSITKTSTSGLTDTYTITYNDDTTSTFTVNNGDSEKKWKLLKSLTTEEEKERIYINTDNDGNSFSYDDFIIVINPPSNSGTVNSQYRYLLGNGTVGDTSVINFNGGPIINGISMSYLKCGYAYFERIADNLYRVENQASVSAQYSNNCALGIIKFTRGVSDKIKEVLIVVNSTTWKMPVGTEINIYAR